MVGKRKGFSPAHSRRVSQRIEQSTIGNHVRRNPSQDVSSFRGSGASRNANASGMEFSNSKRTQQAHQGYVRQMTPQSQSLESNADYQRRVGRRDYIEATQHKKRVHRVGIIVALVVIVCAVGIGAGLFAYFNMADSRLALKNSNASEALVAANEDESFYLLCAAQLGTAVATGGDSSDAYMLVRIDPASRVLTFVNIPGNIPVSLSDGQQHPLYEARSVGGDAELIREVADFAQVDIAHFVSTDSRGISQMVDREGGVTVDVLEEVDDPRAGIITIDAGQQSLDGEQTLVFLRAWNFPTGLTRQAENRVMFSVDLASKAISSQVLSFATAVADLAEYADTDMSASFIMDLGESLRPLDTATVYAALVPGHLSEVDGVQNYVVSSSEWEAMMNAVRDGQAPDSQKGLDSVSPSAVTVEIRNGANINGAGAQLGDLLTSYGYKVDGIGNTDDGTIYPETLAIYKDPAFESAAEALVRDAGMGRVVNGGDYYEFKTDLLVIIGSDWMPAS